LSDFPERFRLYVLEGAPSTDRRRSLNCVNKENLLAGQKMLGDQTQMPEPRPRLIALLFEDPLGSHNRFASVIAELS
jgi:hypothetical protein